MIFPPVFSVLASDILVSAIVESRVYPHGEAPQGVVAPYLTWSCLAGIPEICLDEPPDIDRMTIQVNCWARTGEEVRELADAVRDVLEIVGHVTNIIMDSRDFETKLYWIGIEMDWLHHRQ